MDYSNTLENSCRLMPRQQTYQPHYPYQHSLSYPLWSPSHDVQHQQEHQQQTTPPSGSAHQTPTNNATLLGSKVSNLMANNEFVSFHPPKPAQLESNSLIRSRACVDDENFCSVVSVFRIEYINDTLTTKFWAMERLVSLIRLD